MPVNLTTVSHQLPFLKSVTAVVEQKHVLTGHTAIEEADNEIGESLSIAQTANQITESLSLLNKVNLNSTWMALPLYIISLAYLESCICIPLKYRNI